MNYKSEFEKYARSEHGISSLKLDYFGKKIQASMTPYILEEREMRVTQMDIFSRLMMDRILWIAGPVNDRMSTIVQAQLLFLEAEDATKDILFYINSPGGSVTAGLAIYDTMQFIKPEVSTIVMGQACSMGSFLAMSGAPGKRFVLPESRTMIHRVSSGTKGTSGSVHVQESEFEDARRHFEESKYLNERLTQLYVNHNTAGKTYDELFNTMKFDTFLSAQEAVGSGLADEIITKR